VSALLYCTDRTFSKMRRIRGRALHKASICVYDAWCFKSVLKDKSYYCGCLLGEPGSWESKIQTTHHIALLHFVSLRYDIVLFKKKKKGEFS